MKAIVNATIISQGQTLTGHALVFDQLIRAVCPISAIKDWPVDEVIDGQGLYVAPGLIDIHVHGCGGHDAMDASLQSLEAMARCLARYGVTSFLPTTMTVEWGRMERVLGVVRDMARESRQLMPSVGARVLGVNLEGPFLNPEFRGAHAAQHLTRPNFELIADHLDVIRILTLAPELPGSIGLLERLATYHHVIPAIGHSGASWETVQRAMQRGVRHTTHLFNAMSPMHHRRPGVVGAVLASRMSAELIADNLHVHPGLYSLLLKTHGFHHLVLVSDAMRAAGLDEGEYELGGQIVYVRDGAARLNDGTLAGSVLTLNKAVANFQKATGCELAAAIGLATRNPARLLGLEECVGDLRVGMRADIIIMSAECKVQQTFVAGEACY